MKAVVYDRYGAPDVLQMADVPMPSASADRVLVRILATSVNLTDWDCLRGAPLYARMVVGRAPAHPGARSDIARAGRGRRYDVPDSARDGCTRAG